MNMVFKALAVMRIDTNQEKIHIYLHLLYSLPEAAARVIPASLLFGVCFSVAQFTVTREMVAIQSAGVSFYRAIRPVFVTGALMTVFLFLFQNYVVTPANSMALEEMSIIKKETGVAKDLIWQRNLRGKKGYYFLYYFDRKKNTVIGGFHYLEMADKKIQPTNPDPKTSPTSTPPSRMEITKRPLRILEAKRATYRPATKDWSMQNAREVFFSEDMKKVKVVKHEEPLIQTFPEGIDFFANPSRDPLELNIGELLEEIRRREEQGFSYTQYEVQLHSNISFPFMCLVVSLVGAIVGGMGSHRSSGPLVRSVLISVATMFLYILVFSLGKSLGNSGVLHPASAGWGPTGIFIAFSLYLIYRNRR